MSTGSQLWQLKKTAVTAKAVNSCVQNDERIILVRDNENTLRNE